MYFSLAATGIVKLPGNIQNCGFLQESWKKLREQVHSHSKCVHGATERASHASGADRRLPRGAGEELDDSPPRGHDIHDRRPLSAEESGTLGRVACTLFYCSRVHFLVLLRPLEKLTDKATLSFDTEQDEMRLRMTEIDARGATLDRTPHTCTYLSAPM